MPTLTPKDAAARMANDVNDVPDDELRGVYNELFPLDPIQGDTLPRPRDEVIATVRDYLVTSAVPEELVDLWNVMYPEYRDVWYDEDEELMHCEVELPERSSASLSDDEWD